jgi:hypothetical protein
MSSDRRDFLKGTGIAVAAGAATLAASGQDVLAQAPKPGAKPLAAKPVRVDSVTTAIEKRAAEKMRKRLGLSPTDPLPREVTDVIRRQAEAATGNAVELGASRDTQAVAREYGRMVLAEDFQTKLAAARNGIQIIGKSTDVDAILAERATMLWKKREALIKAGFPAAEAMQILLADLAARH